MDSSRFDPEKVACRRSFARVARFDSDLPNDLIAVLWSSPESLLDRGKILRQRGARRTVRLNWNGQKFVIKHYVEPTLRHALKQLVMPSRAALTWNFAHRLADAGIGTPRPVACIENRWGLARRDSFLMYPYVEGGTLRSYLNGEARHPVTTHDRMWQQLHKLWARLCELKVGLADAHSGNFIVCPAGRLWLIDLDKSRFHRAAKVAAARQQHAWQKLMRTATQPSSRTIR